MSVGLHAEKAHSSSSGFTPIHGAILQRKCACVPARAVSPAVVPSVKRKSLSANRCKRSCALTNLAISMNRKRTGWRIR